MSPTRDLIPPGTTRRRSLRIRARLRWYRMGAVFRDWRYPAALAALAVAAGLVVAVVGLYFGIGGVLDRLSDRALVTDCINERQAEWNVIVGDILLAIDPPPGAHVDPPAVLRGRMDAANAAIRTRDLPVSEGGCAR